jgi:hypothetical protein
MIAEVSVILRILTLEVSVYNVYITNQICSERGGEVKSFSRVTVKEKNS